MVYFSLLCGAFVTVFVLVKPWYYRSQWNKLGKSAVDDEQLLETLLDMGPVGWDIATADTVSDDPEVRKYSGAYCLNGRSNALWGFALDSNCIIFWRIWARRCLSDEKYIQQFCAKNRKVIPVIIVAHAQSGLLKDIDGFGILPVYSKYREFFLQFLDSEGVSPPCPREIVNQARQIVVDIRPTAEGVAGHP
jgi:hypothetical protein